MIWVVGAALLIVAKIFVRAKRGWPFLSTFPLLFLYDWHFVGTARLTAAAGTLILCGIWLAIIQPWRAPGLDEHELLREQARKLES